MSNLEKVQLTLFNQKNGKTEELRSIVEEVEKVKPSKIVDWIVK